MGTHGLSYTPQASTNPAKLNPTKAALRDLRIGHLFWVRNVAVAGLGATLSNPGHR